MKRMSPCAFLAVAAVLLASAPAGAATKTLTVYPYQLKEWPMATNAAFNHAVEGISAATADFMMPIKLPPPATVKALKVWAKSADGGGFVRLIRYKDGEGSGTDGGYKSPEDDLASVPLYFLSNYSTWEQNVDTTIGPAPAKVAAGYRYYLYVHVMFESVGTIQVVYQVP